jgi:hypothetical protein
MTPFPGNLGRTHRGPPEAQTWRSKDPVRSPPVAEDPRPEIIDDQTMITWTQGHQPAVVSGTDLWRSIRSEPLSRNHNPFGHGMEGSASQP